MLNPNTTVSAKVAATCVMLALLAGLYLAATHGGN
jgi:hypothetical protein